MKKILPILMISLLLFGCGAKPCKHLKNCYQANPPLIDFVKETQPYVNYLYHGGWAKDQATVANAAKKYIKSRVADRGNKKFAVVFDVDDTLLASLNPLDYHANFAAIKKEQNEGKNPAIPATRSLFDFAKRQGIALFLITGRTADQTVVTEQNLRSQGVSGWNRIYFAPQHKVNAAVFKQSIRKKISQQGYDIIVNIGDQFSDLCGGYADRVYRLPNPFYTVPGCEALKK